ncbi:MAG TPA: ABC transporter ATP-binding protein [Salinisphaeraceae bacterium]|nr:ABC transporter ATP-binding protein [Salinisphaeraceae bacterium]
MALLEVHNLVKRFGGLTATNNVSLNVTEKTVHSIIGPNGAGKSTFLNQLIGVIQPDSGSITFDGQSLLGQPPHEINQRGIARVFQSPEIFPELTLLENVTIAALAARDGSFAINFLEHPRKRAQQVEAAEQALDEVGLLSHAHSDALNLSRGDKRRLELAICLAHKPRLLLLDEPTAGMSLQDTHTTTELLKKLARKGMTKIVIEHDMKVVFELADEITVLHQGTVISHGMPDEVRADQAVQDAYLGGVKE